MSAPWLLLTIRNPPSRQVIRRQLNEHLVSGKDPNEVFAHLAGDVSQHLVLVLQLDLEHRVGQCLQDGACHFNCFFLRHISFYFPNTRGPSAVIATECSKCAASVLSSVRAVQRSESVLTSSIAPSLFAR